MNQVVIALGSNIEPWDNVTKARALLAEEFELLKASRFTETAPIGNPHQPDFVNGVVLIQTNLSQQQLKTRLRELEQKLGRNHLRDKNAARTIDLDIVAWNHAIVDPDVYVRDFLRAAVEQVCPSKLSQLSQKE